MMYSFLEVELIKGLTNTILNIGLHKDKLQEWTGHSH
jgi:hypothetical protein